MAHQFDTAVVLVAAAMALLLTGDGGNARAEQRG
jgi:hypothetical protein